MEKNKEYFLTIIEAVITIIVTLATLYLTNGEGTIYYSTNILSNGKCQTGIIIKNNRKNMALEGVEIILDKRIKIDNIYIDEEKNNNVENIIKIDKMNPKEIKNITIISNNPIDKTNLIVNKNHQQIGIEYINESSTIIKTIIFLIIQIIIYALINIGLLKHLNKQDSKRIEKEKEKYDKAIDRCKELEEKVEEVNGRFTKKIKETERRYETKTIIYINELADMEKEIAFYQKLLLNNCKEITKEELEKKISSELKTFHSKKIKNLSYNELCKLIENMNLSKEND